MRKSTNSGLCRWRHWLFLVLISCTGCGTASSQSASAPRSVATEPSAAAAEEGYGYDYANDPLNTEMQSVNQMAKDSGNDAPAAPPIQAPPPPAMAPGIPGSAMAAPPPDPAPPPGPTPTEPRVDNKAPLLIYSATLTMAVFGTEQALEAVEKLARDRHGYLVRRSDASITIRVPAKVFQETLDGVGKLGDELHRDVSARDVTEEYADLEIRLRNSEVVRTRLEALLAKSNNVEEALAVERELERVTQTIEQIKGKLKLLGELVAFSTITVNFQPHAVDQVSPEVPLPFEWLRQLGLPHLLAL
jgi:hypothetical protein